MTSDFKIKLQQKTLLNFINEARSLYDRKHFTDVTLQCEGEIFPVHKLVLAANSPYFRDYFIQKPDLTLANMSIDFLTSEVLQIILNYFYTGTINIDKKDNVSLLESIIEASSILQIPLLSDYCLELVLNKTINEMSLSDYKVIEELDSKVLLNIFIQNVVNKLATFNATEDFLQLSVNQIKVFLQCPVVEVSDQNVVFQSILNWVKHDSEGRKEHLTELLESFIDFQRINPEILSELENDQLVFENTYFLKSYFKLVSKHMKKSSEDPDKKETQLKVISEIEASDKSFENIQCNCAEKQIRDFEDVLMKRRFFIFDCKAKEYDESHVYLYDCEIDKLDKMIAHPVANRENAAIFRYEGSLYVFGGKSWNGEIKFRTVYSCHLSTKEWLEKKMMVNFKYNATVAELNGYIYVVGGMQRESQKCVERYNPVTDQWEAVADLPDVNDGIVPVVALNDCLYVWINTKLYKYIPPDNTWYLVETFEHFKTEVHMCRGGETIFIIEKKAPTCVWIYDPKDNSLNEDVIPAVLTECDGIVNLENPQYLEFLVSGKKKWFLYRPHLNAWIPFHPKKLKNFDVSMLTLLPS